MLDIVIVAIVVIVLSWIVHSLFWALVFFILGCLAVAVYRKAMTSRRL